MRRWEGQITGRKGGGLEKTGGGGKGSGQEILAVHIEQKGTRGCNYRGSKVVAGNNENKELDGAGFVLAVVVHCKCVVIFLRHT